MMWPGAPFFPVLPCLPCPCHFPVPMFTTSLCFHNMRKGNMGKTHFPCKIYRMHLVCEETGFLLSILEEPFIHTTFLLVLFLMGWLLETDITREELKGKNLRRNETDFSLENMIYRPSVGMKTFLEILNSCCFKLSMHFKIIWIEDFFLYLNRVH